MAKCGSGGADCARQSAPDTDRYDAAQPSAATPQANGWSLSSGFRLTCLRAHTETRDSHMEMSAGTRLAVFGSFMYAYVNIPHYRWQSERRACK